MNICIFGSSFNPPHNAHVEIVNELKKMNFDKLLVVPTGNPNHKQIIISDESRIILVKEFCKLTGVEYSLHEIEQEFEYTLESIEYLNFKSEDNVYFAIGGDSLNNLRTWDYYNELRKKLHFIVINRPLIDLDESILNEIKYTLLDVKTTNISSSELRKNLNPSMIPSSIYQLIETMNLYN